MKNKKRSSLALLCLNNSVRKNYLTFFFLILLSINLNSCKKDLLVPAKSTADVNKDKIKNISYGEFLSAINLNNTGVLKNSLANASKGNQGAVMNLNSETNGFIIDTDSVKKLVLGDTISYSIGLKPETPHAVQFRNLTIQVLHNKTTAFLTTYIPTPEFVKTWRKNKNAAFKGQIYANKISLTDVQLINGLNSTSQDTKGKVMSINSDEILINRNKISLAPGDCEIYDIIEWAAYPCKEGHWPGATDCFYVPGTAGDWGSGYNIIITTVVNCAPPAPGGGGTGGGGGGSTTPNPPGGYNPCDTETPTVSYTKSNNGLKLAVLPPSPCDGNGGGGSLPPLIDDDSQLVPYWEQTYSEELQRMITFGEITQAFQDNPGLMDAIDTESENIDPCCGGYLLRPLGIETLIDVGHEVKALKALHSDWGAPRLYSEAYWNVTKGKLHFLLDVAGLFPVAGEPFDLANGAIYFFEGNKLDAALSVGSAIPVWGWISTGGKWVKVAITAKPIGHAVTGLAFKVQKTAKGGVRFIRVAANTFSHSAITALKAVKPADNTLTNLSRSLIDQASYRIKPALQSLKNKIDNIVANGDASGNLTENLCDDIFASNGFTKHEAHFGSNNGFDGVYIKKDGAGNVQEIIINEAKQVGSVGNIKLNARNLNTGLQAQMSNGWIDDVLLQMKQQGGNIDALADIIQANKSKITKTVTGVDRSSGEIVVLKLMNY